LPKLSQGRTYLNEKPPVPVVVILTKRLPKGQRILKGFSRGEIFNEKWQTRLPAPTFKPEKFKVQGSKFKEV